MDNSEKKILQQANLIVIYSSAIKEIFNTLKTMQTYPLSQIYNLVNDKKCANRTEIMKKLDDINSTICDIRALFKSNKIEDIKTAINELSYKTSMYEYYEMDDMFIPEMEKYEQYEKAIWNEYSKNEQLYGQEYAKKYINYQMYPKSTIEDIQNLKKMLPRYGDELGSLNEYFNNEIKRKNYTKYFVIGTNPSISLHKLSKRMLPTKVFEYLFSNGYLGEKDIITYSTNQFGRTFETKRGDIQTIENMKNNQKNLHRYNKIDFSKIKNSKYNKILYISNQWDYDSLTKFIKHINETYKGIIFVDEENINDKGENNGKIL